MSGTFQCRSCGCRNAQPVIDLGRQPLANRILVNEEEAMAEPRFPLGVVVCADCWLVQIEKTIPPATLFSAYPYQSAVSETFLRHVAAAATRHMEKFSLGSTSFVVEIASNDGSFFRHFVHRGVPSLGVEPASNLAAITRKQNLPTLEEFFSLETAERIVEEHGQADLVLGNNVFAHAPAINDFVAALARVVKPQGTIVLEFPYLCDMIRDCEFDTIYHEHVFYFSLRPLIELFQRHGLEITEVEHLSIHGGSLRIFATHQGFSKIGDSISALLSREQQAGIFSPAYFESFRQRADSLRGQTLELLQSLKRSGCRIAAYGASAKGSTLLNYYGIGRKGENLVDFVVDRSPAKQGRLTPGSHLPIFSPDHLEVGLADHALLLAWNFAAEILHQQEAYRRSGGKFIVPVPEVKVL